MLTTYWTAFIWGVGVSSGAAIGLLLFCLLKDLLDWLTNKQAIKKLEDHQKQILKLLSDQNELVKSADTWLHVMAIATQEMAGLPGAKPGWRMPLRPGPEFSRPVAFQHDGSWTLYWEHEDPTQICMEQHAIDWPFIKPTATVDDLEELGFEIEG